MKKNKLLLTLFLAITFIGNINAQIQTGVFRTPANNNAYHHFTRASSGAAVYINKESAGGQILALSSGTAVANQGVKFTVEGNGSVTSTGSFRTIDSTNTNYNHFVRDGGSAAVFINQVSNNGGILTLSSGTSAANQGVKFTVASDGSVTAAGNVISSRAFKTENTNTDYHHFTRNGVGAAVYINQISTQSNKPILRLSSGIADANEGVKFTVENNGNVGIGTTSPQSMLDVNGTATANFLKIGTANIPANYIAPDYVFADEYDLLPLWRLKKYVSTNQHLPKVPSAEQIEQQGGANLGAMNVILLEKVEELTLYIIQMNEKIESLNQEVETLNQEVEILRNE